MGGGTMLPKTTWPVKRDRTAGDSNHLWGLVDMGSNGIRFSISDLTPPTSRVLPTLYMYRSKISLYDAQYDDKGNQIPIPEDVIQSVIGALLRFVIFCKDFRVPLDHIRVIATEATRTAINSADFRKRVKQGTGLTIELLTKEEEGTIGAWGIASSFTDMHGLVMDLGGGSTQITWMVTEKGQMKTSPRGAFSFPYGAAALSKRLAECEDGKTKEEARLAREELRKEMKNNFLKAYNELQIPPALAKDAQKHGGYRLYLSGGGFRGWGYLLLYLSQKHGRRYPISIINGFTAHKDAFQDTELLKKVAQEADKIFRVSDRRRAQVPAVAFLVNVLADVIPHGIREAHFCQGGVREGILYQKLPSEVRASVPIEIATAPYARPLSRKLFKMLRNAIPSNGSSLKLLDNSDASDGWDELPSKKTIRQVPESITPQILKAMSNMLYVHADMSKEVSSTAALYSTSTGVLSSTHGVSHTNRALLALLLEARYEGDLPPREYQFRESLRKLVSPAEVWWTTYLGAVALVLSRIYPAGCQEDVEACDEDQCYHNEPSNSAMKIENTALKKHYQHKKPHMSVSAQFSDKLGDDGESPGLKLTFHLKMRGQSRDDPLRVQDALQTYAKKIVKVGKKKHWIKLSEGEEEDDIDYDTNSDTDDSGDDDDIGLDRWGMKVEVDIRVTYPLSETPAIRIL